jgi:uncharacterized protein DUF5658
MVRALIAVLVLFASVIPTAAGERDGAAEPCVSSAVTPSTAATALGGDVNWTHQAVGCENSRGAALSSLYVSFAALNVLDAFTTTRGLRGGTATETNPLMRGVASHSAALWSVKAGSTAVSLFLAERLRRNGHRRQALALMIVANSLMATVAAHNARVIRQGR